MEDQGFSIQDLKGLLARRLHLVVATFLVLFLGSIVIAYSITSLYRSSGTIMIERPEVSTAFLPGTDQQTDQEQRVSRIFDAVMTRDNLATIVDRHALYTELRTDGEPASVVYELRSNFEMELMHAQDDPRMKYSGDVVGFQLSYYHPDPYVARDVTRDIIDLFAMSDRQRRQLAYLDTGAALAQEADNLREKVAQAEKELAEFKSRHPGALPEDRNYNRQIIERKARDLDGLDREIRSLQERKTLIQSQLTQTDPWVTAVGPDGQPLPATNERLSALQAEYLQMLGNYNVNHPDVVRVRREIESLSGGSGNPAFRQAIESELEAKRTELLDARNHYSADHPDIRNLERAVSALEQQLERMPIQAEAAPPPNNPSYINLQLQLDGVNTELYALREDRRLLQDETLELEQKMQVAPEVEREYLELTRDLGLARKQYEDIRSRQMSVERAGTLDEVELSERYVIARSPFATFVPAFPNRPLFIAIGLFLGLTFGLGAAIVAEALDGTIRSTRDIRMIMDMPPIAAVPIIATESDVAAAKKTKVRSIVGVVAAIVSVVIYVQLQRGGVI
jgi:uncharacterized protein involved in exopolysaccharide biosynthesis